MKIIDRYMVRGFLGPFVWCLVIFNVMAIIIDIFSFIEDIVKYKIPLSSLAAFYVYYSPTILIQVAPMAMLLSTIYVLSNLNKNNEIIAMKSSGISLWRILMPILLIGMVISISIFIINDRIIPISSKVSSAIRRDELEREKRKTSQPKIVENVAVYSSGNKIVFARNYNIEKKVLTDVIIHEHDQRENLVSKITAQKGVWTGHGWRFFKVVAYRIDNSGKILGEPSFYENKMMILKESPGDFASREWRSDFMSYKELKRYIRNFKGVSTKLIKSLMVDLHYKVSFAFINIIIVLIGAPFALITTRGGVLIGVGMSIVIGLLYYAVIAISLALGKAGIFSPLMAAWFGNVAFAVLGIYLVNKRS